MELSRRDVGLAVSFIFFGFAAGYFGSHMHGENPVPDEITRAGGYHFINPLLSCDISEDTAYPGLDSLRNILREAADSQISARMAKRISIYFRDMDTGHWTGVRTDDLFMPASLMKVPLMITYYKDAEKSPSSLQKLLTVPVSDDGNRNEYFKPKFPLKPGVSYSEQDVLSAMIRDSDNNAEQLLDRLANKATLANVYGNFGVDLVPDETSEMMSPKIFMRFFRILYNASYLSKQYSMDSLNLMAESTFQQGLVAGMPAESLVSHKFGERSIYTQNGMLIKRELHDCGIVYYPGHPYGICVMTEGDNLDALAGVIAEISKVAYDQVDSGLLKDY